MELGFGGNSEKQTQMFFRDDLAFQFRSLPLEDTCLVQKKNGIIERAWKHFYAGQIFFRGYKPIKGKGIDPCSVTLAYNRDFILDPFNKIPTSDNVEGKPRKNDEAGLKKWTAQIAESQRYKVMVKGGTGVIMERITLFLCIGLLMEFVIWGITRIGA